ncbi:MAG: nitroreductase [Prevotella sp.]|nr:nitroreductase [Prevotella sp.]
MTIAEAINQRHSVRKYAERPIEQEKLEALKALVNECNEASGLNIQLITDDPVAFDCMMAHYGRFAGVSNYFAMVGPDNAELDERVGYYGEKLVLKAQMLGLNTCWVGLSFKKNREVVQIREGEKLRCVISLGYGVTQGSGHKIKSLGKVARMRSKEGKSLPCDVLPEWFKRGVEAALLAPTSLNQQKFTFTLHEPAQSALQASNPIRPKVSAKAGLGFFSKVDLGIVKYHFEIGAGVENFEWTTE